MSNKPILFFSPNCKHCIQLWNILKQKNIIQTIDKVNVSTTRNIPKNVKSVPCLLVPNRPPIEGNAILLFFNNSGSNNQPSRSNQTQANGSSVQPSNSGQSEVGIKDYMPSEMSGRYSDQYSFIDNNNPIHHSYTFLDGGSDNNIQVTQSIQQQNSNTKNARQSQMEARLEQLKQSRSNDLNIR